MRSQYVIKTQRDEADIFDLCDFVGIDLFKRSPILFEDKCDNKNCNIKCRLF